MVSPRARAIARATAIAAVLLVVLSALTVLPREAEGRPTSPRAQRRGTAALVGKTVLLAPATRADGRGAELPACPPEHPFVTPWDGKLSLRSAYRGPKPQTFQHCPHWSGFGPVRGGRGHGGIDIAQTTGTAVRSAASGQLVYARDPGGYGLFARVHFTRPRRARDASCSVPEEYEIVYAHLQEEHTRGLPAPRAVKAGEVIGHVGCTGNAHGMCSPSPESHLHVTVQHASGSRAKIDPASFLGWPVATPGQDDKPAEWAMCGKSTP